MNTSPNKLHKRIAAFVAAAGVSVGLMGVVPSVASADVVEGQFVDKSGLTCGGQERITGDSGPFKQYSWIYYNCGDATVMRKSDAIAETDGDCMGIGPGQARVIDTRNLPPELQRLPRLHRLLTGRMEC